MSSNSYIPLVTEDLKVWLETRDTEYYTNDTPTVDDVTYDTATTYWREITGKPWESLGKPSEKLTRIQHVVPMLSLEKHTEIDTLVKWTPKQGVYVLSPKVDGMACRLKYADGKLVAAYSRGDGSYGESILHSLKS